MQREREQDRTQLRLSCDGMCEDIGKGTPIGGRPTNNPTKRMALLAADRPSTNDAWIRPTRVLPIGLLLLLSCNLTLARRLVL